MERKMKEAPVRRGVLPGDQPEQTRGPERGAGSPAGSTQAHPGDRHTEGPVPRQAAMHLLPECQLPGKCFES